MYASLGLPTVLAVTLSSLLASAFPTEIPSELVESRDYQLEARDNRYHLNCSNAPTVVAGYPVDPGAVVIGPTLPESGSAERWNKYLWCTTGTRTYTFFNYGGMDPGPEGGYYNMYQAFLAAKNQVDYMLAADGEDHPMDVDGFSVKPPNTGVSIYVKHSKGTTTLGILKSAMVGMMEAASNYNFVNAPMLFQINDGPYGETGIGYAGLIDAKTLACIYDYTPEKSAPCQEVQSGKVDGLGDG